MCAINNNWGNCRQSGETEEVMCAINNNWGNCRQSGETEEAMRFKRTQI